MIKWAGRLLVLIGGGHMASSLALTATQHAGTWFRGGVYGEHLSEMSHANGAFWVSVGSFGIPQIVLGATVLWMDRKAITPPAFIGWTMGAWSVLGAIIFEPAPWPVTTLAGALLVLGGHRAARREATAGVAAAIAS
ncbi:hypothetical protein D5S18_18270 [Nocardia panacis]|uniref:Uncharacterized protein n=1 Tax=Nocardia panacis TaxID=2340916 RepID=A0A3A4JV78_9NOCA|nr:DUF6463 family protein [Nocardia panacis]RJO74103.1 hypothetical protein D5S18_18270 [Nocardia panacis]